MAFKYKKSDGVLKKDLASNKVSSSGIYKSGGMISCGKLWLDRVSGDSEGIFPRGAISEVAAAKGCGKTTLSLETIAYNQLISEQAGEHFNVLYVDFEHNLVLQKDLALGLGADLYDSRFFYRQPSTLEGGAQMILEALDPKKREEIYKIEEPFHFIVIDTLAAAMASCEVNMTVGTNNKPGFRAKLWSDVFRNIQAHLDPSGPVVVINNHTQQIIDMSGTSLHGPPRVDSKSSEALKFYSSQRYFMTESYGSIEETIIDDMTYEKKQSLVASKVTIKCDKSKVGKPKAITSFFLKPGEGFDIVIRLAYAAIEATQAKVIKNAPLGMSSEKSSWMYVPEEWDDSGAPKTGPKKYNGVINLIAALEEEPKLRLQLAKNLSPLWEKQVEIEERMRVRRETVYDLRKDASEDLLIPEKLVELNDFSNIKVNP